MKTNSQVAKWGKALALLPIFAFSAVLAVAPTTASATVVFDLQLGRGGVEVGSAVGQWDDVANKIVSIDSFSVALPAIVPAGSFDLSSLNYVAATGFQITWNSTALTGTTPNKSFLLNFLFDTNAQNQVIDRKSGNYTDNSPAFDLSGNWRITPRGVPEPGSLVLLGLAVVGFGLAQYRRKTA